MHQLVLHIPDGNYPGDIQLALRWIDDDTGQPLTLEIKKLPINYDQEPLVIIDLTREQIRIVRDYLTSMLATPKWHEED